MWKITFFFSQFNFTWTETYYVPLSVSYSALVSQCQTIAGLRVAMNASQCKLSAIRIVNLTAPRLTTFVPPGTYPSGGSFIFLPGTDPDQDSAPQFVALQVKFFGAQGHVCRRYMSGIPEGVVGTKFSGSNIEGLGLLGNALTAFVAGLGNYGWSFRFTNQAGILPCSKVTTNAQFPNEIGFTTGAQLITALGATPYRVYLKGWRKVNYRQFGLGGVYALDPQSPGITAAAAPFAYYLLNTSQVQPSNIPNAGSAVQLLYGYDPFGSNTGPAGNGYTVLSVNHRKRGASALALRGRSRSKP